MNPKAIDLENMVFEYMDKIKRLLSSEIWENILLDCSKNELFAMVHLYRHGEVNMSQLAEYLEVPLNTMTGIITRMEKRQLLIRQRSQEDKRVVTVLLTEQGHQQMTHILGQMMHYGQLMLSDLSAEEFQVIIKLVDRMLKILEQEQQEESVPLGSQVKKIIIE